MDVVIDVVQTEITTTNNRPFYGLYNNNFPRKCWTNDGRLVLATNQKNTIQSYVIDLGKLSLAFYVFIYYLYAIIYIDAKTITQLGEMHDSFIILGVFNNILILNRRNFFKPDMLTLGKLENDITSIEWNEVTPRSRIPGLENHVCHYLELFQRTDDDISKYHSTTSII